MYIPDLFGAYTKGRELAIEKNWQDLKNFESVEAARNQNDLTAMDIWERRQQMPGKMNMFYNNVDTSQMNTDVAREAHPGVIAKARMGSGHAQDQFSIWQANRDYGRQVMNRGYQAGLAMTDAAGQNKAGQANYWLTDNRAYQHGRNVVQQAYDTQRGNSITAAHYPTVAQQQNTQGDLTYRNNVAGLNLGYDQIKNAHELLPQLQALVKTNLGNQQADASSYQTSREASRITGMQQQEFDRHRLIAEMMNAHTPGSGTTYLMGVMGIGGQTATPAQATPATGQTQSGVPVGTNSVLAPTQSGVPVRTNSVLAPTQSGVPVRTNSVLAPTGTPQTNQPVQDIRSLLPLMFQNPNGGQVYNYPASPEHGQYRPLVPAPTPQEVQQQQLIKRLSGPRQGGIL